MHIMVVGGTGLLGYHTILAGIRRGHTFGALSIDDIPLNGWYPDSVALSFGNVFTLTEAELTERFQGYDALVYAVGPDDRVTPPAPAYEFFHTRLVEACLKTVTAAVKAGVKRCVIMGSYFAYFDRIWPDKKLSSIHPYIRCRVEQEQCTIEAGAGHMDVMILELPYIFGSMPERMPIWRSALLDRFDKGRVIFFPKGGTSMIAVQHVGEAAIGAMENGSHGGRYPVGDENHTFHEMLEMFNEALGKPRRIINIPRFIAVIAGRAIRRDHRKKGLESGLDPVHLMRNIMTDYCYFDSDESAKVLGFERGGLKEAIADTVRASYTKN